MRPSRTIAAAAGLLLAGLAGPAHAIEFWDGRIEAHGYYESRMSFGVEDFEPSKGLAMYGWLHVVDLEVESQLAPDGWGPFDLVTGFTRIEVTYDCVWNHACGLIQNVNTFGDHVGNLPHRVQSSHRQDWASSQHIFDKRAYWYADRQRLTPGLFYDVKAGQRTARPFEYAYTAVGLFGASPGPNQILGDMSDIRDGNPNSGLPGDDDAGLYLFDRANHCKTGTWSRRDSSPRGYQTRELLWSIDGCDIQPLHFLRTVANPFRDFATYGLNGDVNPVLQAIGGPGQIDGIPIATALPLRPGSENPAGPKRIGRKWESQGVYVPNARVRHEIQRDSFDSFDQNYSLRELQWNRGASQQETKELREAYLDLEMFDSRLWLRLGKQTVVWGKTEIFRNQDQWNPVDIGVGPLASLEEARIPLWMARGVWSFYEVGPFQDVRTEFVVLYDQFEPTDLGRCGEPYVPRLACDKSFALYVHGQNGDGLAGEMRPEDPWSSTSGIEVGGRLEFRWERFTFALSDYWGYNDNAYTSILFQYDRNVDPLTGRPRQTDSRGPCTTGNPNLEPACLAPGSPLGDVVAIHSINQSMFAWVCAGTVGVAPDVDPSACAFTLFNSARDPGLGASFAKIFSSILAGSSIGAARYRAVVDGFPARPPDQAVTGPGGAIDRVFPGLTDPLVPLVNNGSGPCGEDPNCIPPTNDGGLNRVTTFEQQALWGCGPFYFTNCDVQGIDLGNADASVTLQAFPWFEGTYFDPSWDTTDPTLPQPGTVDAAFNDGPGGGADAPASKPGAVETGPAGSRYENGKSYVLPGAHYDPAAFTAVLANAAANGIQVDPWVLDNLAGYDITKDGSVGCETPQGCRKQPFTGQIFSSEMAIASWNLLMLTASLGAEPGTASLSTLDPEKAFALGRCSFRQPQYCSFVSGFAFQARKTSSQIRAGGNGTFGRRNFVWASVGDAALRYQKRNIVGFSTDFAEDRTKSSWGVEFTWVPGTLTANGAEYDELSKVDEYNLTISVDRPTFINFLNANRTFLLNSQLFTSYLGGYQKSMYRDGPWTFLWLLNASTGYFQDRFLVSAILVFDLKSRSGAFLPTVQYRFTENFSISVGASVFGGGFSKRKMGINQFSAFDEDNQSNNVWVENGISPVRDLDGFFAKLRYTF